MLCLDLNFIHGAVEIFLRPVMTKHVHTIFVSTEASFGLQIFFSPHCPNSTNTNGVFEHYI